MRTEWHGRPLTEGAETHHPGRVRRQVQADELEAAGQLEVNKALLAHLTGIERVVDALENLVGTPRRRVLWSGNVVIPANGVFSINLRQPARAIWVTNYNGNGQVIVVASTPQGTAPGAGPGTHLLPAGVSQVFHGESVDWSLYGTAGNSLDVQLFGVPVQPFAGGAI